MRIWAHMVVQNEENFVWFSLMSVINFVEKVLVVDTGSTDSTVQLIKELQKQYPNKIEFTEKGEVSIEQFPQVRQQMVEQTKADWILVLDGDEIWWQQSLEKIKPHLKDNKKVLAVAVPFKVPLGDLYHYQDDSAGRYQIAGQQGHLQLRFISTKITGLHVAKPYGQEGYYDQDDRPIQELPHVVYVDAPYLHCTHLARSSKARKFDKYKYELGHLSAADFLLPEVFYLPFPKTIANPLDKMSQKFYLRSFLETGLRKVKRKIYR